MLARITTELQGRIDLAPTVKSISQMVVDFAGVDERPKTIAIRYAVCSNLGPTVVIPAPEICSDFQFFPTLCLSSEPRLSVAAIAAYPGALGACLYNQFQLKKESRNETQTYRVFRPCKSGVGQLKFFAGSRRSE